MKPSLNCYNLIKSFEGYSAKAYPDPGTGGQPFTIGYGTTRIDGHPVPIDLEITQEQALNYLEFDVDKTAEEVNKLLQISVSQSQFDALVSFAYNVGTANLAKSSLLRLVNLGHFDDASDEFLKWNRAAGRVLVGLTKRRSAERTLFLS